MDKYQFLENRCQDEEIALNSRNLQREEFVVKYRPIRDKFWLIQQAKENPSLDSKMNELLATHKDHPDFNPEWLKKNI